MKIIPELHYSLNLLIGIQQSQNSIPAAAKTDTHNIQKKLY